MITPHPVVSSNISLVGWADDQLYVAFKSGGAYRYADVPNQVFVDFLAAESAGKFFHSDVKPQYAFTALTANPFN